MHKTQNPDRRVRALATEQAGLLSAEQAGLLGLSHQSLRRLVRDEHWVRLSEGVYDLHPGTESFEKRAWAAGLRAGNPSAIGGEAALRLYGLDRLVGRIVLWVPPDRRPRSDEDVAMRRDKVGRLNRVRGLLPRIRAEDAVVDVAEALRFEEAVALVSEAARRRLVTTASLRATISARARVRHRKLLIALLDDLDGIESTLEYIYRRDVERAHGLPKARRQRSVSSGTRTDVLYEEFGLLVELDGKAGHQGFDDAFRDLHRDNIHALRHLTTLRYGSADIRGRPCEVAAQVVAALRLRGWTGPFDGCPACVP